MYEKAFHEEVYVSDAIHCGIFFKNIIFAFSAQVIFMGVQNKNAFQNGMQGNRKHPKYLTYSISGKVKGTLKYTVSAFLQITSKKLRKSDLVVQKEL